MNGKSDTRTGDVPIPRSTTGRSDGSYQTRGTGTRRALVGWGSAPNTWGRGACCAYHAPPIDGSHIGAAQIVQSMTSARVDRARCGEAGATSIVREGGVSTSKCSAGSAGAHALAPFPHRFWETVPSSVAPSVRVGKNSRCASLLRFCAKSSQFTDNGSQSNVLDLT